MRVVFEDIDFLQAVNADKTPASLVDTLSVTVAVE